MGRFREFRRRVRSRRNLARLRSEVERYNSAFLSRGLSVPGEREILGTIRERFPGLAPRPKGALHILAIYHDYNWEEASLTPSLERFGDVRRYDWAGRFDPGSPGWNRARKEEMNEEILGSAERWHSERPFDLVFCYLSGELATPGMLARLRGLGAPIVNLSLNDKEWFVGKKRLGDRIGMRDICRHFDLCWTSTRDALEKYCVEGAVPVYLPEGANPELHRPYDLEKTFDVTFVGQCYGNRPEVVRGLREAGIRIEAFGKGWPNGPLPVGEMVRLYSKSRINLGFGGVAGHEDTFCLKGRDFEVPMSGGLYVTEDHDELRGVYEVGKEIVAYSGMDELVSRIRWLLDSPEEAARIRTAGRERALRDHTWEKRFEKVFRTMGLLG